MQDILFWHNCEVLEVSAPASPGAPLCVSMSAAAVEREGKLSGFLKPLSLRFHGARFQGSPLTDCIGVIAEGELRLAGGPAAAMARQITLPWRHPGTLSLSLTWRNGSHLLIEADAADALPASGARFIESYAC